MRAYYDAKCPIEVLSEQFCENSVVGYKQTDRSKTPADSVPGSLFFFGRSTTTACRMDGGRRFLFNGSH